MKRNLRIERLFTLGEFQNIKFVEEINDIPEEITLDEESLGALRFLMLLNVEISFRDYVSLKKDMKNLETEVKLRDYLENSRIETLKYISNTLSQEKEKET